MNVEVEFFKSRERKVVVLRKISVEEQVTDFDATIIFEDKYEIIFRESKRISKLIEKNYREYMGDKHHLKVELDSLVYIGDFYLTFSQWAEFCTIWNEFEASGLLCEKYQLSIPKSRRELRND